jgi:chromatin modification-related protein YNG2
MHVERIEYDASFFDTIKPKLDLYFGTVVLPRMIRGKEEESEKGVYCSCRKGEYGKMIACDNPNCKYQWFHYKCVNIKVAPKGSWFCSNCLKS